MDKIIIGKNVEKLILERSITLEQLSRKLRNTNIEYSLIKEGIEVEFEFKLGFKTAVCLMMQILGKEG